MTEWTREQAGVIIDSLLNREVRVTKQMIRDGYRNCCHACPVALAILAVLPGHEVSADYEMITIDRLVRFSVPEKVEKFMRRFDNSRRRESISGIRFTLTEFQHRRLQDE